GLGHAGLPLAASLGLHTLVGLVLVISALSVRGPLGGGSARSEVVINIPPPPATPPAPSEEAPAPAPAAPVQAPPPVLQGMATRIVAPPPALRSAGPAVPSAAVLPTRAA